MTPEVRAQVIVEVASKQDVKLLTMVATEQIRNAMAAERERSDQILKEVHEALFTHSRPDIHKALCQLRSLDEKAAGEFGCQCWFSLNTGPNGECEKCGKIRLVKS